MKKFMVGVLALCVLSFVNIATAQEVTLEMVIGNPEEESMTRQVWDLYEEENPNVKIKLVSVNEEQRTAFQARIAGGDVPAFHEDQFPRPTKENYTLYVDLQTIDYPYWDLITSYDNQIWKDALEADYVPGLIWKGGRYFSFIFHRDMMEAAGLDPRESVRTWEDLEIFLEQLKVYVDATEGVDYVWDIGWHAWAVGKMIIPQLANGFGGDLEQQEALFRGEIDWMNQELNPFVPAFKKLKEWTEKGYLPAEWWTREWESEFEAGFIGKKSLLCYHGPWIWNKVEAADASADLSGFPLPTVNGKVVGLPIELQGSGIYAANQEKPYYDEVVKAFIWYHSPEILKLRYENLGMYSTFDLSSVGGIELTNSQAVEVALPLQKGYFGDLTMDFGFPVADRVAAYKVEGKPNVLDDNQVAYILGDYISGKTTLEQLLAAFKQRWEEAYQF